MILNGAGTRSRTRDLLITSQLLYQLSYTGLVGAPLYPFVGTSKATFKPHVYGPGYQQKEKASLSSTHCCCALEGIRPVGGQHLQLSRELRQQRLQGGGVARRLLQ